MAIGFFALTPECLFFKYAPITSLLVYFPVTLYYLGVGIMLLVNFRKLKENTGVFLVAIVFEITSVIATIIYAVLFYDLINFMTTPYNFS